MDFGQFPLSIFCRISGRPALLVPDALQASPQDVREAVERLRKRHGFGQGQSVRVGQSRQEGIRSSSERETPQLVYQGRGRIS